MRGMLFGVLLLVCDLALVVAVLPLLSYFVGQMQGPSQLNCVFTTEHDVNQPTSTLGCFGTYMIIPSFIAVMLVGSTYAIFNSEFQEVYA